MMRYYYMLVQSQCEQCSIVLFFSRVSKSTFSFIDIDIARISFVSSG